MAPRLQLHTADVAMGYVDAAGTPWFNAAQDPPDPASQPDVAGSSAAHGNYKASRARAWFLAACHLLAHTWGASHDDVLAEAHAQVVLRCSPQFQRAFFGRR